MSKNIMDTQDLSDIRKMLGDTPVPPSEEFDLDSILAEVGGTVQNIERERREPAARPAAPQPKIKVTELPVSEKRAEETRLRAQEEARRTEALRQAQAQEAAQERMRRAAAQSAPQAAPVPAPKPEMPAWEDEEPTPRESRRQEKEEKKQRRAETRAKKQKDEDEETYAARDPRVAQASCARRARSLAGRSVFVLLMVLGTAYLTLAGGFGLPLPEAVRYETNTVTTVLVILIMQFLAMLVGIDTVGGGLYMFFTGQPDRKTLVSFALLGTLAHGITIIVVPAWGALLPYCSIALLLLFAIMQEEKARFAGRSRAFKAAQMATRPTGVYFHRDDRLDVSAAVKSPMETAEPFLIELEKPDTATRFAAIYTPVMLAASVVFALIVSVAQGVPSRFFWALSGLLVMSAPLGLLCAAGPAYRNVSRRLLAEGAAISGARGASRLCRAKQVVLTDSDLFPAGSITVDGVRNYGQYPPEKLLAYAAAVTGGQGLEIGRVFSESLREQYGRPVKATNVLQYESGGLSADIMGDSVLIGTAAFLMKLHIRIRDIHGVENGVFVVVNNQVAGVFVLTYHPSAPAYGALHAFRRMRKRPVLATRDFNITPAMVESLFELRNGTTDTTMDSAAITNPAYVAGDTVSGILTHSGITPMTQLLHSAERLSSAVRTNLGLGTFSGICGVLLVFYLEHLAAFEALQPKNLFVYLLLWYLPMFFMTLGTRRKY